MTSTQICPYCARQQPGNLAYCAYCGSPLPGLGTGQLPAHFALQQGRYLIVRAVGQGGMGAVYQAADTRLGGKAVAIKEMSDAGLPTPQQRQQAIDAFRQEAQMLALLKHPNLPQVTDYFTENGKHYIVMEFVEGETLEDTLSRRGGTVSEGDARGWAAQLCDVLGYLHRQQPPVIFRDLKPANVMLTPQGQLKLIDFGIARFYGQDGGNQRQITFDGASNLRPAWSPDSRELAFTSDRDGTTAIWVVPIDLSQPPRRISPGAGFDSAWSRP